MKGPSLLSLVLLMLAGALHAAELPPAAARPVDFVNEIKPLLEASCIKCHAKGKAKGEFSLETREAFLKGGETGAAVVLGKSAESLIVELLTSTDSSEVMPKKGTKWTAEQVGLLRAWIDQGMPWAHGVTFAKPQPENLHPRAVALPAGPEAHPVDRILSRYFAEQKIEPTAAVEDRIFARRAYLDTIGLLPSPAQLEVFLADSAADKRAQLIRTLLADRRGYAEHWLTFWNDLLRNDYKGTGFIDGGRKQISGWLFSALYHNTPYDRFVAQLVNPTKASEGFARGIIWRGNVNASMTPPMQAAQNISQVFMGVNIKCASCHDSFINDWALADAYGLAAIYSDERLELVHCDKPTGKTAAMTFLYPQLGAIDESAAKPARLQRLAEIMTSRENGRLSRTVVNRLWARLLGRGLVEPIDDMEQPAWSRDLLDWLAEDLVAHRYDLKRTLEVILTSRAYQLQTVEAPAEKEALIFRGPLTRRLTAEQFSDALSGLGGTWARLPSSLEFEFGAEGLQTPQWIWTDEPPKLGPQRQQARAARQQLDAAMQKLAAAKKKAEEAAAKGEAELEPARLAAEQAAAAVSALQGQLKAAALPPTPRAPGDITPESDRHRVVFRKRFQLSQKPTEAYAAILASQRFEVQVNGKEAKPIQRDGTRNGRIALLDLKPLLVAGENVIAIDVSSHTEKSMNDNEKAKHPGSVTHLNAQSGLAFYARCELPGGQEIVQLTTDETWRTRRNPEGSWLVPGLDDADWLAARPLPLGIAPVDEGPGLEPITRKDFANLPVELGSQLSSAISTAAHVGEIRASLLAADALQSALDRPTREQIIPVRLAAATTLQALELTNGSTLDAKLKATAGRLTAEAAKDASAWIEATYRRTLTRPPTPTESAVAAEILGVSPKPESVSDFLWALVNLPEFQLIN